MHSNGEITVICKAFFFFFFFFFFFEKKKKYRLFTIIKHERERRLVKCYTPLTMECYKSKTKRREGLLIFILFYFIFWGGGPPPLLRDIILYLFCIIGKCCSRAWKVLHRISSQRIKIIYLLFSKKTKKEFHKITKQESESERDIHFNVQVTQP